MSWLIVRRFWPHLAAAAALIGVGLWHVSAVRDALQEGYAQAQAEYAAELAKAKTAAQAIQQRMDRDYRNQIDALNRRSLSIDPGVIRVSVRAPGSLPARTAPEPDAAPKRERSDMRAGGDIAGPLVRFATECERDRRAVIAWQAWAGS